MAEKETFYIDIIYYPSGGYISGILTRRSLVMRSTIQTIDGL